LPKPADGHRLALRPRFLMLEMGSETAKEAQAPVGLAAAQR
jgi:hypothetical protein